ncbi:MAG: hypothetical protein ACPGJR_03835 [Akkermansiaceae bacterium]
MCEDFPVDDLESPTWDRKALDYLRIQLEMGVGEFDCLLEAEKQHPAFDPISVRNLLREKKAQGFEPGLLILGRLEMASFRHFVSRGFGEESGSPLGGLFFLGIPVAADACPTRLEFVIEDDLPSNDPSGQNAA